MMIAQHQTEAASSPSITILTIQSALRNSPSSEKFTGGSAGTVVTATALDATSCASDGAEKLNATTMNAASTAAPCHIARRCPSGRVSVGVMKGPFVSVPAGPAPAISLVKRDTTTAVRMRSEFVKFKRKPGNPALCGSY